MRIYKRRSTLQCLMVCYLHYAICNTFEQESDMREKITEALSRPDIHLGYIVKKGDNEPCEQDANCIFPGQICRDGFCSCPPGKFFIESLKSCYNRIYGPTDECEVTEQCENFARLSSCTTHVCKCPASYKLMLNPSPLCMFQENGLSQQCYGDENCRIPGQGCIRGICQCVRGTFYVPGRGECFNKINSENDVCKVNEQCSDFAHGSRCVSSYCRCPDNYMLQTSPQMACIRAGSGDHELCIGNMECPHRSQICSRGLCYRRLNDINDQCEVTDQCEDYAPGSRCVAGYCSCPHHLKLRTVPSPLCVLSGSKRNYSKTSALLLISVVITIISCKF